MGDVTQFLEIVGWDDFMGSEHRKKLSVPYQWVKLPSKNLDTLGDLTLREYGGYIRLLHLAAQTGNRIAFRPEWIRRRTNVTQSVIKVLLNRGLIEISSAAEDVEKKPAKSVKQPEKIRSDSGTSPEILRPRERGVGVGEKENNRGEGEDGSIQDRASTNNGAVDPLATPKDDSKNSFPSPAPTSRSRTGQLESLRQAVGKKNGHDRRPFDDIKSSVLEMVHRLNTSDPDQIHRLAGQTLRASEKQIRVCIDQLTQDGDL